MSEKCEPKIGTVMPSEYDWRGQFREMCKDIIFEGTVDTGKVWGLCCEIDRLTARIDELEEAVNYWKEVCEKLAAVEVREHPNYGDDYGDEGKSE